MSIADADIMQRTAGLHASGRTAGGKAASAAVKASPAAVAEAVHFDAVLKNAQRGDSSRMAGQVTEIKTKTENGAASGGGFLSFLKTVLDVINPLQHLPVISTIYRHITGDEISPAARVVGGTLYGGPIGAAIGVANAVAVQNTGRDIGENVIARAFGKDGPATPQVPDTETAAPVMLAAADIIWNDPAVPAHQNENQNSDQHGTMLATADRQEILSSVTPTSLRTRTTGTHEPAQTLPYAPPVHTEKKGMLAPTESTQVVSRAGLTAAPDTVGERNPAPDPAETVVATTAVPGFLQPGASPVLQLQDAPARDARRAKPPEQIASAAEKAKPPQSKDENLGLVAPAADARLIPSRMMEALDKYAALKQSQNNAAQRGLVSVHF